jgi:hypothetical protein
MCAIVVAACGDNSTAPSTTNIGGTWTGNLTTPAGTERVSWILTQSGSSVNGTVSVVDPTALPLFNGTLSGTLTGSTLTYAVTIPAGGVPAIPTCTGHVDGTMTVSGSSMSGSFTGTSTCQVPISGGTLTLAK